MKPLRTMRRLAVVAMTVLVATTALATPSSAASKQVDSKTVGTYSSSEACGRTGWAQVSASSHWTTYSCTSVAGGVYQLRLLRYETVPDAPAPEPAPQKVLKDQQLVGTYSSSEACGRTGASKLAGQTYWTAHTCLSNGSGYALRLQRWALPNDNTPRPSTPAPSNPTTPPSNPTTPPSNPTNPTTPTVKTERVLVAATQMPTVYGSQEACGRASVTALQQNPTYNAYRCVQVGTSSWRLNLQRYEDRPVEPKPTRVLVAERAVGTYGSGEACGRASVTALQQNSYYNAYKCVQQGSYSYQLRLQRYETRLI